MVDLIDTCCTRRTEPAPRLMPGIGMSVPRSTLPRSPVARRPATRSYDEAPTPTPRTSTARHRSYGAPPTIIIVHCCIADVASKRRSTRPVSTTRT
jgi:hypothetical protein